MKRHLIPILALVGALFAPLTAPAQIKVSELPAASTLTGTETVPLVQSGTTKRSTAGDIVQTAPITATGATYSRTLATRLSQVLSPLDFMPAATQALVIAGTASADTCVYISAAITAANAKANGGVVDGGGYSYPCSTGVALKSNVTLRNATLVLTGSSASCLVCYSVGGGGVSKTLAADAARDARTITLNNVTSLSVGTPVLITSVNATSGQTHYWPTKITAVSSPNITLADPMATAMASAEVNSVQSFPTRLTNAVLENVELINQGSANPAHGVNVSYTENLRISHLRAQGFTNGAAVQVFYGLNTQIDDARSTNSGSISYAAFSLGGQVNLKARGLVSYADNGFGIEVLAGAYATISDVDVSSAGLGVGGRGFKLSAHLGGSFANGASNNNGYSGVAIANESRNNLFVNWQVHGNGWSAANHGLWTSDQYNTNNTFVGLDASGNANYDIAFTGATDSGNRVYLSRAANVFDTGTGSQIALTMGALGASDAFSWSGRSQLKSGADGAVELYNAAGAGSPILKFGGTSNSFPALKRNGNAFDFRLADDSAYSAAQMDTLILRNGSKITDTGNGSIELFNNAGNDFTALFFGGTSASFPRIDRSSATLAVKLADGSNDAGFTALYMKGKAVAVASLPTCNAGLEGARMGVTDSNAALTAGIGAAVANGGANHVPVYCDGTSWKIG